MKTSLVSTGALLFAVSLLGSLAAAQNPPAPRITTPAPSPESTLKQKLGFTDIEIAYGRPGVKGRKVFGGLVPYGEVWRTGANSATKVSFSTVVKVEGRDLPAGAYALYTIPGAREWTIIFNRVTGEWGAYSYKQENDAMRVTVKPVTLAQTVETFTIDVGDIRTETAVLSLAWEKTRVPVRLEVDVIKAVVAQIDTVMGSGATLPPAAYFQAAMFYFDHGLDLRKAKAWVEAATKGDKPLFYMLHGKAKILAKLGDNSGAKEAATQSIAAAQSAGAAAAAEYRRLNEALIATLK